MTTSRKRWRKIQAAAEIAGAYYDVGKVDDYAESILDERDALRAKLAAAEARALPEGCVAVDREKLTGHLDDVERCANAYALPGEPGHERLAGSIAELRALSQTDSPEGAQ